MALTKQSIDELRSIISGDADKRFGFTYHIDGSIFMGHGLSSWDSGRPDFCANEVFTYSLSSPATEDVKASLSMFEQNAGEGSLKEWVSGSTGGADFIAKYRELVAIIDRVCEQQKILALETKKYLDTQESINN